MRDALATERYLERYSERDLPECPAAGQRWQDVLVIPAYREDPTLLERLAQLQPVAGPVLVMLVLNRPDTDSDELCNQPLRDAISALPRRAGDAPLFVLAPDVTLYLHDMDNIAGPLPAAAGVGLARKTGCDIALNWWRAGAIASDWLHLTDADATLPRDYLRRLRAAPRDIVAATFPFHHTAAGDGSLDRATALYELRLHHYVLGLEYAGSPYAFHTLGSALAVRTTAYCHVRGIPRRAGAEDFYLLNKLAKVGKLARLDGECIQLASRASARVPFGTGPAVAALQAMQAPCDAKLFYDPRGYAALRALLRALPHAASAGDWNVARALQQAGIDSNLARLAEHALVAMGAAQALAHCRRQGRTQASFTRHFHQWFDGSRTLKFMHALRDGALPAVSLAALAGLRPNLWPDGGDVEALRAALRARWGWRCAAAPRARRC